ncbi:MAG TPA: hypothetical protein VHX14_14720 [Thermoanaerobaculia bacterium]|jgi:hypothetical protein|nr:hypothetical protein [Thermoanaerobaculia bacterium]
MIAKGIQLTLLIGPAVPVAAPKFVIDALQSVTVRAATDRPSGFELKFAIDNRSTLSTLFLLVGGATIPIFRVIIVVTVGGTPNVLMDGVITQVHTSPEADGAHSTLTVMGQDLSRVMDFIDFSGIPYPATSVEVRVALVLAKYAVLGVIPVVVPRILTETPVPTKQIPKQKGKDLEYIQELAKEAGHVFYVEPGPAPGSSIAYWGPDVKVGIPQPALNVNMDAHTNVEALSFRVDGDRAVMPIVMIQNPKSHIGIPIPVPNISPLNPPLGIIPTKPKEYPITTETGKLSAIGAALLAAAKASRSSDNVVGTGSLNVLRYGRPLKARKLVGVRGAGDAFDGLYYVEEVTHDIKRGEYKQQFTIRRSGLRSTVRTVPV